MTKHRVTRRLLAVALSVLLVLGCVAPAVAATYESGTYTGTGTGRNGSVALTLTLTNGAIASVDNVTHSETARYWEKAKVLLDRLVGLQTPEQVETLDAVTGATMSSNAIKEAAKDVFRQAESKETPVFASGSGTKSDPYLIRTQVPQAALSRRGTGIICAATPAAVSARQVSRADRCVWNVAMYAVISSASGGYQAPPARR